MERNQNPSGNAQIGIVAHISRSAQAGQLADRVHAAHVNTDDGALGCNANHLKVWKWHRANTTTEWAITLEDDAVPIDAFLDQLPKALRNAPAPIVSLYLGRMRPPHYQTRIQAALTRAATTDACYALSHTLFHAVGVAIRTPLIVDLTRRINTRLPIDEAIGQWARHGHHGIAYTLPSLIDHLDQPSIVKHRDSTKRTPGRTAWQVGQRDNWTRMTVEL